MSNDIPEVSPAPAPPDSEMVDSTSSVIPSNAPPPYPGELVMWRRQVTKSRRQGIRERRARCLYVELIGSTPQYMWWDSDKGLGGGALSRDEAPMCDVQTLLNNSNDNNLFYIVIDEEEFTKHAPKVRRSSITSMVSSKLILMLAAAPNNETFRARLMAEIGEMPPKEADDYQKLKDWVEFTFPKVVKQVKVANQSVEITGITNRYSERGSCSFTRRRHFNGNVTLQLGDVLLMAQRASSERELRDELYVKLRDTVIHLPHSIDEGSYYHFDYDIHIRHEEQEITYSNIGNTHVKNLLMRTAPPAVLAKFGWIPTHDNPHVVSQVQAPAEVLPDSPPLVPVQAEPVSQPVVAADTIATILNAAQVDDDEEYNEPGYWERDDDNE